MKHQDSKSGGNTLLASEWNKEHVLTHGLDSAKGSSGVNGQPYYATDTKILYLGTGTGWEEILRGETATRLAQLTEKSHANLTNVTANQHHAQAHESEHESGGGDALPWGSGGGLDVDKVDGKHASSFEEVANKDQASGYAGLDSDKRVAMVVYKVKASGNVRNSNDAEKQTSSELPTYTKIKETKINEKIDNFRVYFTLRTGQSATTVYAKIYKNGVAIGTSRSNNDETGIEYSEDFAVALVPDDLLQIYACKQVGGGANALVKNFRIAYDVDVVKSVSNQDP